MSLDFTSYKLEQLSLIMIQSLIALQGILDFVYCTNTFAIPNIKQ